MNRKISRLLGVVVTLSGFIVMAGWILDIDILKSILPHWVTMKFSTALSFLLSGIILYCGAKYSKQSAGIFQIILTAAVLSILLLMATFLISTFIGMRTGVEDLFVKESEGAIKTTTPGRPSVGTMTGFILMSVAGIITMLNPKKLNAKLHTIGWMIALIAGAAVFGYIFNAPVFYYTVKGFSTAMAFHTALLFLMLGTGLILLRTEDNAA